jgi:hypothetical protein
MKIALMCPTRNRMNKLLTLISSLITTVKNPNNVNLVLGIDEDDPAKKYYTYLQKNVPIIKIIELKNDGKFLGLSTMWNHMVEKIDADIYALVGDDMMFKTQDWDAEITKEFENGPKDKIIMVHCNDGMRGPGNQFENVPPLCVNFFIHKNYIKTTGYFVEPYIENIHQDTWTQLIFNNLKRSIYRHDILIKHLHFSVTDNNQDPISQNLEELRKNIWNNHEFTQTYKKEIEEELQKLKIAINKAND